MSLSKQVLETLIDLVEIKLSCIEVYDREDGREVTALEQCRRELQTLLKQGTGVGSGAVVVFPRRAKGRPRAAV